MIPFKYRFHGHSSLNYVYKKGEAIRSRLVTIKFVANSHRKDPRLAVVVSKKTLKSAVRRNRIRRRVYECVRPKLARLNKTYDIVFIVTSGEIFNISHQELSDTINQLISQAGIQKPTTKSK